jgi:hypothetical protein
MFPSRKRVMTCVVDLDPKLDPELKVMDPSPDPELDLNLTKINKNSNFIIMTLKMH